MTREHHEVRLSREDFFEAFPGSIWHEDEPIVWPSSVSLYFVARLARERVKVVLTGEGSDETLAGYTRYAWTLLNARSTARIGGSRRRGLRRIRPEWRSAARSARPCAASWNTPFWGGTAIPGLLSTSITSISAFARRNKRTC